MPVKKSLLCAAALVATALLFLYFPVLPVSRQAADPGSRQLITVWLAGDLPGASAWARSRAAAFSRSRGEVGIWLRTVTEGEMEALTDTPPDLLLWAAGVRLPEALAREEARPVCLSGYVLIQPQAEAAATPAPRSLFGVSPTPDPARTPMPEAAPWPEVFWADDGFGALALRALGNPGGAAFLPAAQVAARAREGEAALLSLAQLRTVGVGYRVVAAAPATDLVLYAALTPRASSAAREFADALLAPEAQTALSAQGLLSVLPELRLYGPDQPAAFALQFALAEGWLAPADWAEARDLQTWVAQALYAQP